MEFDKEFCQEEERCGYVVPTEMKKIWSVQLDLLARFQEVCKQHNLRYFAAGGTLLGAIRHKGYIPWDDDVDVVMLREDYDKLLQIAPTAFAEPYFFQTSYNDKKYSRGIAQLRNSNTTGILMSEKGKFPFNQGIFIDIFPLDALPDDPKKRAAQVKKIRFWNKMLAMTVRYPGSVNKSPIKGVLHALTGWIPYRFLHRRMDATCSMYKGQKTNDVGAVTFILDDPRFVYPLHCFDQVETVPFEQTTIDIPAGYDEILTILYGDYMVMKKENSYHGGVLFDTERSYKDYIR